MTAAVAVAVPFFFLAKAAALLFDVAAALLSAVAAGVDILGGRRGGLGAEKKHGKAYMVAGIEFWRPKPKSRARRSWIRAIRLETTLPVQRCSGRRFGLGARAGRRRLARGRLRSLPSFTAVREGVFGKNNAIQTGLKHALYVP